MNIDIHVEAVRQATFAVLLRPQHEPGSRWELDARQVSVRMFTLADGDAARQGALVVG